MTTQPNPVPARGASTQRMTVTANDTSEWRRMARAAVDAGHHDIAARMLVASDQRSLPLDQFDARANEYRAWLVFGVWCE